MNYLGISYDYRNKPSLEPAFLPFAVWEKAYLAGAERPFKVAVEREAGNVSVFSSRLRGEEFETANYRYMERFVKFLLWSAGGLRVTICGCEETARKLQAAYTVGGTRDFDWHFMDDVFESGFEIVLSDEAHFPKEHEAPRPAGGHLNGCRIGFDAGGSDRKVSAVIDGKTVYSEEVVWHPKTQTDPQYHYDEIVSAFRTAAAKMPRVDGIGVSSAGVFIGNAPMVSSLFIKVPREKEVRHEQRRCNTDSSRLLRQHKSLKGRRVPLHRGARVSDFGDEGAEIHGGACLVLLRVEAVRS